MSKTKQHNQTNVTGGGLASALRNLVRKSTNNPSNQVVPYLEPKTADGFLYKYPSEFKIPRFKENVQNRLTVYKNKYLPLSYSYAKVYESALLSFFQAYMDTYNSIMVKSIKDSDFKNGKWGVNYIKSLIRKNKLFQSKITNVYKQEIERNIDLFMVMYCFHFVERNLQHLKLMFDGTKINLLHNYFEELQKQRSTFNIKETVESFDKPIISIILISDNFEEITNKKNKQDFVSLFTLSNIFLKLILNENYRLLKDVKNFIIAQNEVSTLKTPLPKKTFENKISEEYINFLNNLQTQGKRGEPSRKLNLVESGIIIVPDSTKLSFKVLWKTKNDLVMSLKSILESSYDSKIDLVMSLKSILESYDDSRKSGKDRNGFLNSFTKVYNDCVPKTLNKFVILYREIFLKNPSHDWMYMVNDAMAKNPIVERIQLHILDLISERPVDRRPPTNMFQKKQFVLYLGFKLIVKFWSLLTSPFIEYNTIIQNNKANIEVINKSIDVTALLGKLNNINNKNLNDAFFNNICMIDYDYLKGCIESAIHKVVIQDNFFHENLVNMLANSVVMFELYEMIESQLIIRSSMVMDEFIELKKDIMLEDVVTTYEKLLLKKILGDKKSDKKSDKKICDICLGTYEDGDKIMILSCGHFAHENCQKSWFASKKKTNCTCQICRESVPLEKVALFAEYNNENMVEIYGIEDIVCSKKKHYSLVQ